MSTRNEAIQRCANKLKDIGAGAARNEEVVLSDTEIGEEVDAAVSKYSGDHPRERVADITGTGSQYYAVSNLAGYLQGLTVLRAIEYPATAVGATKGSPDWLDPSTDAAWYRDATTTYLFLPNHTPAASETVRVTYTSAHTLDNSTDTIPTNHFDAVCDLAAAYCCSRLEARAARTQDSTIAADVVNYRDAQLKYRQTRTDFLNQYERKVGLPADGVAPATAMGNWGTTFSWGGGFLRHPARWR